MIRIEDANIATRFYEASNIISTDNESKRKMVFILQEIVNSIVDNDPVSQELEDDALNTLRELCLDVFRNLTIENGMICDEGYPMTLDEVIEPALDILERVLGDKPSRLPKRIRDWRISLKNEICQKGLLISQTQKDLEFLLNICPKTPFNGIKIRQLIYATIERKSVK